MVSREAAGEETVVGVPQLGPFLDPHSLHSLRANNLTLTMPTKCQMSKQKKAAKGQAEVANDNNRTANLEYSMVGAVEPERFNPVYPGVHSVTGNNPSSAPLPTAPDSPLKKTTDL
ncbi:hypothetical protein DDE82_001971 [Stemphylium lycopersici]|nr:hypothetical protein DDE82_001971 [Stemphylium lycopersici]